MNTSALLEEGSRRRILNQAHDFFRYPNDYLDPSWLEDSGHGAALERARQIPGSRRPLADWALQHFRLNARLDCDFSQPCSRMALLDTGLLLSLVELAGVLAYVGQIPETPDELALSGDLHRFAHSKAPFLSRVPPDYCIHQPIEDWTDEALVQQGLALAGLKLLSIALHGVPPSVTDRLALKLPRSLGEHWRSMVGSEEMEDRVADARRLILKLYREVEPSCSLL